MQIDCYGFEATSQFFKRKELSAYLVKRVDGITYICFSNEPERPFIALIKTSTVQFGLCGLTEDGRMLSRSDISRLTKHLKSN